MLDYYEIDADVIRIANDPKRFTFIRDCKPDTKITLGDARLTLAANADARYDLILVDAFSSDSIPVHLLTREAMAVYLQKLRPGGLIGLHLSNRNLELVSVAVGLAASHGLVTLVTESADDEQSMRLGAARAQPVATGLDRRLFQHRRRDDAEIGRVTRRERKRVNSRAT